MLDRVDGHREMGSLADRSTVGRRDPAFEDRAHVEAADPEADEEVVELGDLVPQASSIGSAGCDERHSSRPRTDGNDPMVFGFPKGCVSAILDDLSGMLHP